MVRLAAVTHTLIYPHTSTHTAHGHLAVGGCDVVELAASFGTPLFIYDEQTVRDQCRAYHTAFAAQTDSFEITYASKAFCCRAICELVAEEGLGLDVASGGELTAALEAGFPSERISFHGNNKTLPETELALQAGVGYFVVDSFQEIETLNVAAGGRGRRQKVLVRLTPGVRPSTHSFVQTGQADSKFGFGLTDGLAEEAVRRLMTATHLELVGVHAHIGSQIFDLASFEREVEILVSAVAAWQRDLGFLCRLFNMGGGLGIRYTAADQPSSISDFAATAVGTLKAQVERQGIAMPTVVAEPGRSIVGKAGITAYTVGTVKHIPGVRTYVAVDGGMSDNMRPMLYDSRYEVMIANKAETPASVEVTVAGKHCESGDMLVRDVLVAPPEPGDILVTPSTGAYGYAMANNYNGQPRPAVIMVSDGEARVIIARETWQDVVRLQRPLRP
jgi:diaminopimelate decarboxylase